MIESPQGRALPVGMAFRAQVLGEGSAMVLSVTGELDVAARAQMDDALEKACAEPGEHLTVDVSGLSFMDASGLSLLVAAHNRLVRDGRGGVVVKGASGIVRRVFEITELTSLLDERPAPGGSPAALAPQERPEWPE